MAYWMVKAIDPFHPFIGWVGLGPKRLLRFDTKPLGGQPWRPVKSLIRVYQIEKSHARI
jgi:hypothetical protein